MAYYLSQGNRVDQFGNHVGMIGIRKFDTFQEARAFGYRIVQRYKDKKGYVNMPNGSLDKVKLDVVFIATSIKALTESDNYLKYYTVMYGQPNRAYPKGIYLEECFFDKKYGAWDSHWTLLNKDGTLGKRFN